jgi:hypothetical protein
VAAVLFFAWLDLSDFDAQELTLILLEEWKSHLVDVQRVDALDGLTLKGTVEEDAEEVVVGVDLRPLGPTPVAVVVVGDGCSGGGGGRHGERDSQLHASGVVSPDHLADVPVHYPDAIFCFCVKGLSKFTQKHRNCVVKGLSKFNEF